MSRPEWYENDSKLITGSDGIDRTLKEWYHFIHDSIHHIKADTPLEKEIENVKWEAHHFFQCKEDGSEHDSELGELTSYTGDAVFTFFRLAIEDAYLRGSDTESRLENLSSHMQSLADRITSKTTSQAQKVGFALTRYIETHGKLPAKPKDLEDFTKSDVRLNKIPRRTIADQLKHYKLEDIIRGNQPG